MDAAGRRCLACRMEENIVGGQGRRPQQPWSILTLGLIDGPREAVVMVAAALDAAVAEGVAVRTPAVETTPVTVPPHPGLAPGQTRGRTRGHSAIP